MGSRTFRVINMDGTWPVMAVGGDLKTYQDCLIMFKSAWTDIVESCEDTTISSNEISNSSLRLMKQALVKNREPRRQPNLVQPSRMQ